MDSMWQPPRELVSRAWPIVVAILIAAAAYWWSSAPSSTASADLPASRPAAVTLVVDVEGAVRHPGVLRMRPGARVIDAVDAAGGLLPGAQPGVNLARVLADGELLVLGSGGPGTRSSDGRVDVNRASISELDALPGIGAVLAQRIVDHRSAHGPFRTVRDLLKVPGIGDAKFRDLKDSVSVG